MRENRMEKNDHRYKLILGLALSVETFHVDAGLPIQSFEFIGVGIYLLFLANQTFLHFPSQLE